MKKNAPQCNENILLPGMLTLKRQAKNKSDTKIIRGKKDAGVIIVYRKKRLSETREDIEHHELTEMTLQHSENESKGEGKKSKQRRLMDKYISLLAVYYPVLTMELPVPIIKNFRWSVFEDIKLRGVPLTEKDVLRGLRAYVSSSRYHSAVLKGQWRYNIHGEPVEEINAADKAYAGKMLKAFGRHKK